MSDKPTIKVSGDGEVALAVIFFFVLLWQQSGWYRIDCALGVSKACALIQAEYDKAETKK